MNTNKKQFLTALVVTICLAKLSFGCASVSEELFLQNVEIGGPPGQLPIHVTGAETRKNSFRVSPHFSVSTQKLLTSSLETQYSAPVPDTLKDFRWNGLRWNIPRMRFGLDIDYAVSDNVAMIGGISSSMGKESQFLHGHGGFGLFGVDTAGAFRLTIGVQYNETSYRSASVLIRSVSGFGSKSKDTTYFLDRGKDSHINLFADITINSSRRDWFVNYFFQFGISPQSLTSFTPTERAPEFQDFAVTRVQSDQRAESSVFWLTAATGVYFAIGPSQRVVLGVRVMRDIKSESTSPGLLVFPMLQLDWIM